MSDGWAEFHILVAENGGYNRTFTLKSSTAAIDITGYTFHMEVRTTPKTSGTLKLTHTPTIASATAGQMQVNILHSDAELTAMAVGTYYYDIFWTPSGGTREKIMGGNFTVANSVTNNFA